VPGELRNYAGGQPQRSEALPHLVEDGFSLTDSSARLKVNEEPTNGLEPLI
jgi:hypothetical protein